MTSHPVHDHDYAHEKLVVLESYRTEFEAEVIATNLRDNGIEARVQPSSSGSVWAAAGLNSPREILVFESDLDAARLLIAEQ